MGLGRPAEMSDTRSRAILTPGKAWMGLCGKSKHISRKVHFLALSPFPRFWMLFRGTLCSGKARQSQASPSRSEQMAWHPGSIQAYSFKNSTDQGTVPGKHGPETRLAAQASRAVPGADALESGWRGRWRLLQTSQFDPPRLVAHDPSFSRRHLLDPRADGIWEQA